MKLMGFSGRGSMSKTRPGRKNYTTKKGSKFFQSKGHRVNKGRKPYGYHKGTRSKTRSGKIDFMR